MATLQRVIVTPARLFEFLTMLIFGARRRTHILSTAFETSRNKTETGEARCLHTISNLSLNVKNTTEVGRISIQRQ